MCSTFCHIQFITTLPTPKYQSTRMNLSELHGVTCIFIKYGLHGWVENLKRPLPWAFPFGINVLACTACCIRAAVEYVLYSVMCINSTAPQHHLFALALSPFLYTSTSAAHNKLKNLPAWKSMKTTENAQNCNHWSSVCCSMLLLMLCCCYIVILFFWKS